jgi:hypothetical protein
MTTKLIAGFAAWCIMTACGAVAPAPEETGSTSAPALAADAGPTPASTGETNMLSSAVGTWKGTKKLWLQDPNAPELCDTAVVVSTNRISYTWSYQGRPQSGIIELSKRDDRVHATWTDTWHSPEAMDSEGTDRDGRIVFTGSYAAGDGADWSWRTELDLSTRTGFGLKMFNIMPTGEERIAVQMELARASD